MSIFIKFAIKYFKEAKKDFERSKIAYERHDYPQCVFYAQQCVEKCVKAMLELKRKIVYNHGPELIATFIEVFGNEWVNEFNIIIEALEYLSRILYTFSISIFIKR